MTFLFVFLINNHIYKKYNQKNKLFMVDEFWSLTAGGKKLPL